MLNKLLYLLKKINNNQIIRTKEYKNCEIIYNSVISNDSELGEYTYVGYNCFITKSKIGRYVSIANNVAIGDGEHPLNKISTSGLFYDNVYETLTQKEVLIGNDVWIGSQSIIRRGVTLGNGVIVGANSFVNKDVPDFAIVVGSPAKIIRFRFTNEQINIINNSKWWNYDLLIAKNIVSTLNKQLKLNTF